MNIGTVFVQHRWHFVIQNCNGDGSVFISAFENNLSHIV